MQEVVVRNGVVVNEDWSGEADVTVREGRIHAISSPGSATVTEFSEVIDASGCYVVPGGVDPHCHVDNLVGEYRTLDNVEQATRAAVWGGTTTIVDFAIPEPGESTITAARSKIERVQHAWCDVALHGCVTNPKDADPQILREVTELGISTIKMFTTYRDVLMVNSETIYKVTSYLSSVGGLPYIHAESNHLIEAVHDGLGSEEDMAARRHASTRPEYTETAAVEEILSTTENAGLPVYFVHQSSPSALGAAQRARLRGGKVYTESCPHYLILDDSEYQEQGERFVCCPPLRDSTSVARMREALVRGEIDTIGSDHNCFSIEQKLEHNDDVRRMPNGLPGVETRMPIMFSEFVATGAISPSDFVRLTSTNPARLTGLYPHKGLIAPEADADLAIIDPRPRRAMTVNQLHEQSDYTPYEGRELRGEIRDVIVNGNVVVRGREWVSENPGGKYVRRSQVLG